MRLTLPRAVSSISALFLCVAELSAQSVRVNWPLDEGGDVQRFAWSPDGSRILYAADQQGGDCGLYSAARSASRSVSVAFLGRGLYFWMSPVGHRVAFYWSLCLPPYCFVPSADLHCAPVDGSYPLWDLNQGLPGVPDYALFNADGSRVVFSESLSGRWVNETGLFSNASDGSQSPVSLSDPPGMLSRYDYAFETVRVSPDGGRVAFKQMGPGHDSVPYSITLFSVPVDRGQPPVALHPPFFDAEQDLQRTFQFTPDSSHVLFVADLDEPGVNELFSAPSDGGSPPLRLGPPLALTADVDPAFRITPDGARALIVADFDADEVFELWSAPTDATRGGTPQRLSGKPVPGGDVARGAVRTATSDPYELAYPQFELTPDGTRVVYRADERTDEVYELFCAPLDGSAPPLRVNAPFGPGQDVALFGFRISADSCRVVYAAEDAQGVLRLFAAALDGDPAPVALGGAFAPGGGLWLHATDGAALSFELTPDGATVLYLADQRADEVVELFAAPTDGSRPARVLNDPLVSGGDVRGPGDYPSQSPFALSPDGKWVAYLADQTTDEVHELFLRRVSVPRTRSTAAGRVVR